MSHGNVARRTSHRTSLVGGHAGAGTALLALSLSLLKLPSEQRALALFAKLASLWHDGVEPAAVVRRVAHAHLDRLEEEPHRALLERLCFCATQVSMAWLSVACSTGTCAHRLARMTGGTAWSRAAHDCT